MRALDGRGGRDAPDSARRRRPRHLGVILVGLLVGCASGPPAQWAPASPPHPSYTKSLNAWTRTGAHYHELEGRLFVTATCFSPDFASAYARQRARRQGLPATEAAMLQRALVQAAHNEVRFFMSVATADDHWNDLENPKSSLRLRLFYGLKGEFIEPLRIERVDADELADLRLFFPYSNPLAVGYVVLFPAPPAHSHLRLRVAGPPAVIDLDWQTR